MKTSLFQFLLLLLALTFITACTTAPMVDVAPEPELTEPVEATATLPVVATATTEAAQPTEAPATAEPAPPNEPTATTEPTEPTGVTPTQTPGSTADAFCPDVPRPAAILFVPGEKYVVVDPVSGQSCDLPFPDELPGILQVAHGSLYYHAAEGDNLFIKKLSPDGTTEALPFTTVNKAEMAAYHSFAVSPDGRYIAWSAAGNKPDDPSVVVSQLQIAEIATGEITGFLEDFTAPGEGPYALVPLRFSDDGGTLFYDRQPVGLGGFWASFVGRHDNLYSMPLTGGAVTTIFECASQELFLCIGDFQVVQAPDGRSLVGTLVYTNDQSKEVVVMNGDRQVLNTLPGNADYVGYPTLSKGGELVYYTADFGESDIEPEGTTLYRVAPPTSPAEAVVSDPVMLLPQRFLGDQYLVVGYSYPDGTWGHAVVDLMNRSLLPLDQWPNAQTVGVLPANTPAP